MLERGREPPDILQWTLNGGNKKGPANQQASYQSIASRGQRTTRQQAKRRSPGPRIAKRTPNSQGNTFDCGVFLLAMAHCKAAGRPVTDVAQQNMPDIRRRILLDIVLNT